MKGDDGMNNYNIVKIKSNEILILLFTPESPFEYLSEISADLKEIGFSGLIILDTLLHSGNNEERFIGCKFKNNMLLKDSFEMLNIPKKDEIRRYLCDYLKNDLEYVELSSLATSQIRPLEKGCVI